jgi:hypothetical protein
MMMSYHPPEACSQNSWEEKACSQMNMPHTRSGSCGPWPGYIPSNSGKATNGEDVTFGDRKGQFSSWTDGFNVVAVWGEQGFHSDDVLKKRETKWWHGRLLRGEIGGNEKKIA